MEKIEVLRDFFSSLNRMWMIFNRVVDVKDGKSISEFIEERDRIHRIIADLTGE